MLTSKLAPGEQGKYENIKCTLNDLELIKIALHIASGMQHLERKKVRDKLFTVYLSYENIVPKCHVVLALQGNIAKFYAA